MSNYINTKITTDGAEMLASQKYKKRSRFGEIFHRVRQNKGAMVGAIIIIIMILTFFASLTISFDAVTVSNVRNRLAPPSWQYPLGTDNIGRNLFLRLVYGTRYSLVIGLGVVGIGVIVGVLLGSIAGYYGGKTEQIIMRVTDVYSSVPGILLGMVIMTALGQTLPNLICACGITTIPMFVRISRASVLTVRNNEFVEAAHSIGLPNLRIILTEVLPNGLSPIIVTVSASIGMSITVAAAMSYMGFGVQVPHPEWGAMISAGSDFARSAPWVMTFPGVAIMFVVLAFNLLGDGLRDALDPKLKK